MKITKRILAMLMALMMTLGVASAFAEMPARANALLLEGKTLQTKVDLEVDAATLGSLVGMMTGAGNDEATQSMMEMLIGIVNKIKVHAVANLKGFSGSVGTEKGELFHYAAKIDPEKSEMQISTNLLPGVVLKPDPETIQSSLQMMQMQNNMAKIQEHGEKYAAAAMGYYEKNLKPALKVEEGALTLEGIGEFDSHVSGPLNNKQVLGFLKAMLQTLKEDKETLEIIRPMAATAFKEEKGPKNMEEALAKAEEELDKAMAEEEKIVVNVDLYQNSKTGLSYLQFETPVFEMKAFYISLLTLPMEDDCVDLKGSIIFKEISPVKGDETAPDVIDWKQVREEVLAGQDAKSMLINFDLNTKKADNKLLLSQKVDLYVMGMPLALTSTGEETLTGAYESKTVMGIALMTPDPLITITTTTTESAEAPAAPELEGATILPISETIAEKDTEALKNVFMEKGLPQLMENLQTALPDEAPILMQMMSGGSAPQEGN